MKNSYTKESKTKKFIQKSTENIIFNISKYIYIKKNETQKVMP